MSEVEYKLFSGVPKMAKGGQSIDWSAVETQLNDLVSQGWEVVSSHTATYGLEVLASGSHEPVITFVLRRQRRT
jgi:hypothetical protein